MLIAIAGPQGSGKSTVVSGLSKQYNVVETKFSRSILSDWNVSLEMVNDDYKLSMKFQDELIDRKHNVEFAHKDKLHTWVTERTFMDSFVYTLINFGKNNKYSEWLNQYYTKCLIRSQIYDYVWYLRGGLFHVEHDGVRGSNHHYARMVDNLLYDHIKMAIHPSKLSIIDYADLDQRLNTICAQVEELSK